MTTTAEVPGEFAGRRFVVTGAGSGIGLTTTRLLVERRASVIGAAGSEAGRSRNAGAGGEADACDVTVAADRDALSGAAERFDGPVAAHGETTGQPVGSVSGADWDRVVGANPAVRLLPPPGRAALAGRRLGRPRRVERGQDRAIPEVTVYTAAKAGILSLTRSFATAHAAGGMRVNPVTPGIIDTPMQRRFLDLNAPLQERRRPASPPIGWRRPPCNEPDRSTSAPR